jgi:hypothetical protein
MKDKLQQLHDRIKDHPYRMNKVYGEEQYYKIWNELFDALYYCLQTETYIKRVPIILFHDGRDALRTYFSEYLKNSKDEYDIFLEKLLGYIHRYLDGGRFDKFELFNRAPKWQDKNKRIWSTWLLEDDGCFYRDEPLEYWTNALSYYEEEASKALIKFGDSDWHKHTLEFCRLRIAKFNKD